MAFFARLLNYTGRDYLDVAQHPNNTIKNVQLLFLDRERIQLLAVFCFFLPPEIICSLITTPCFELIYIHYYGDYGKKNPSSFFISLTIPSMFFRSPFQVDVYLPRSIQKKVIVYNIQSDRIRIRIIIFKYL